MAADNCEARMANRRLDEECSLGLARDYLQNLVELQALAVGAEDKEVFAAFVPERKEDGNVLDDGEGCALECGKSFVDVVHVKCDVVDVAVCSSADFCELCFGHLVEFEDH